MQSVKEHESGFSTVELLLSLIVVVLLVFVGYYIWHTQDNKKAPSSTTNSKTQNYFTINEWGVRAPYSGNLTMQYRIVTQGQNIWAYFSSAQLTAIEPDCSVSYDGAGVIERVATDQDIPLDDGSASNQTPLQVFGTKPHGNNYSRVGNYYYIFVNAQAPCGTSQSSVNLQFQTESAIKSVAENFQAI